MRFSCATCRIWLAIAVSLSQTAAYAPSHQGRARSVDTQLNLHRRDVLALATAAVLASTTLAAPSWADEIGREVEAPTVFTGENLMICTKRGPLGACIESTARTVENDNDKSKKYFRDPSEEVKQKQAAAMRADPDEGNALIQKLRQQTIDNKEKNDLYVQQKTFENDQSATFGPFDRQVVILNTDGRTFTLLENAQAMRLKNAGFIEGRKFVKQPTAEDIEAALEPDGPSLVDAILGKLGQS